MNLTLLLLVACPVFFFRVAEHERLSPWFWSTASIGLVAIAVLSGAGTAVTLIAQAGLFAALWWANARRQSRRCRRRGYRKSRRR